MANYFHSFFLSIKSWSSIKNIPSLCSALYFTVLEHSLRGKMFTRKTIEWGRSIRVSTFILRSTDTICFIYTECSFNSWRIRWNFTSNWRNCANIITQGAIDRGMFNSTHFTHFTKKKPSNWMRMKRNELYNSYRTNSNKTPGIRKQMRYSNKLLAVCGLVWMWTNQMVIKWYNCN